MRSRKSPAFGKLNLTLDVLGKRSDGYHEMRMLMQTVSLCDDVTVAVETGGDWRCNCAVSPEDNLAIKAARAFFSRTGLDPHGLTVTIEKRIPVGGGMAGGSADAAATLRALNGLYEHPFSVAELCALGAEVGSDVPYCVRGGTALAEGRGERLTPLPSIPPCTFVLAKPDFAVSTPALFRSLDARGIERRPNTDAAIAALKAGDLPALCRQMKNVFQPVLEREHPVIRDLCDTLADCGALAALLTGTGSVVYGVFDDPAVARIAADVLTARGIAAFSAQSV